MSIFTFQTAAAPPSGTISKCGQVRRPYLEPLQQPTKFEKNRTRGSAISPIVRQPNKVKFCDISILVTTSTKAKLLT